MILRNVTVILVMTAAGSQLQQNSYSQKPVHSRFEFETPSPKALAVRGGCFEQLVVCVIPLRVAECNQLEMPGTRWALKPDPC